ncbi:MAG: stage III sporulation protein AD [Firmicutes bacterium]|nr:stage III sporulation protein AD [Bacillota bacterium]
MDIFRIVGFALLTSLFMVLLRRERPELAHVLAIAAGTVILILVTNRVVGVLEVVAQLADRAGVDRLYLGTLLRVIGVAYMAEFGAQVCKDAGEGALASKVELAGKVIILILAVPIVLAVSDMVLTLLL